MDQDILVERTNGLLTVTLNRPRVRNAVNAAMSTAIAEAMEELDADDALSVGIVTGADGTFSAGMDLKAFLRGELPEVSGRGFAGVTQAPPRKPLIAAVEGIALAGGCELALACDLIVAAEDASFGLPEVSRGLIAGSGGLLRLPRKVPPQIAMEHVLTGDKFTATDAHRWGLVNQLTAPGQALVSATELAGRIARNGPLAVQATKRILVDAPNWPAHEVWDRQQQELDAILSSADAAEGAAAFNERREPRWTGT